MAQTIISSPSQEIVKAARRCMEKLLTPDVVGKEWYRLPEDEKEIGRRLPANALRWAAENDLVWLVLHAPSDSKLPDAPASWGIRLLEAQVIRPQVRKAWIGFCLVASRSDKDFYHFVKKLGFDFTPHAVAHVWMRLHKYKDMGGKLRPWVRKVLRRHLQELERKWLLQFKQESLPNREQSEEDQWQATHEQRHESEPRRRPLTPKAAKTEAIKRACIRAALEEGPLTEADIGLLKTWKAIDGIIVGCDTDFYRRVPPGLWDQWRHELDLREMPTFEMTKEHPFKRREHIAVVLGKSRGYVDQRWKRIAGQLKSLRCISQFL